MWIANCRGCSPIAEAVIQGINQDHVSQTGHDLSNFIPAKRLKLGDELVLDPPRARDRYLKKGAARLLQIVCTSLIAC